MLQKGQQHGLEIDSEVLSTYAAIDAAANGLDQIQELWNVLWEFLRSGVVSSLATRD